METVCLLQESINESCSLLGILLSLDLYKDNNNISTCVIFSDEKTKTIIQKFPKKFYFNIDFNIININTEYRSLPLNDYLSALLYTVETYGECLFINKDLLMTNPFSISEEIKNQNIGFIKNILEYPVETNNLIKYSLNLMYINNIKIIKDIIVYFEDKLEIEDLLNYNLDDLTEDAFLKFGKNSIEHYLKLQQFLIEKYNLELFLNDYMYASIEYFFAFKNGIKLTDITNDFAIKSKDENIDNIPISFIDIRLTTQNQQIQDLTKSLMIHLCSKNCLYMNIINIKCSTNKLQMIIPPKKGISIWDRTSDCSGGMYELCELIAENNDYLTIIEVANVDYFSFGNYLITDKPSNIWMNNSMTRYSGFLLSNYDSSLLEELDKINAHYKFLCYYATYPRALEEFVMDREEFIKTSVVEGVYVGGIANGTMLEDYSQYLATLAQSKFALVAKMDVNFVAELLGLGVIPVFAVGERVLGLEEDVHFIRREKLDNISQSDERRLRENCIQYYKDKIVSSGVFRSLINHVFVGNF